MKKIILFKAGVILGFGLWVQSSMAISVPESNLILQQQVRGQELLKQERYLEAYDLYMLLLRQEPGNVNSNLGLAEAAIGMNQQYKALHALDRLLTLYPGNIPLQHRVLKLQNSLTNVVEYDHLRLIAKYESQVLNEKRANLPQVLRPKLSNRLVYGGKLTYGIGYSSNANTLPSSKFLSLGETKVSLKEEKMGAWGSHLTGLLDGGLRLQPESNWWLVGDTVLHYSWRHKDEIGRDYKDFQWLRGGVGGRYLTDRFMSDIRAKVEHSEQGKNKKANLWGGDILVVYAFTPKYHLLTDLTFEKRKVQHDRERSSNYWRMGQVFKSYYFAKAHVVMVGYHLVFERPHEARYGYKGYEGNLKIVFKLSPNWELVPFFNYRHQNYQGLATIYEKRKRVDNRHDLGLRLVRFFDYGLQLELVYNYFKNHSNSPLRNYDRHLVGLSASWKF